MTESFPTEIPYERRFLEKGQSYIKKGNKLFPCESSVNPFDFEPTQELLTVLGNQMGRLVLEWDSSRVTKEGFGVRRAEGEAMSLVSKHTDVPVPEVIFTKFSPEEFVPDESDLFNPDVHEPEGTIGMTIIPGVPLDQKWDTLDEETKESLCLQLWDLIAKVRDIPLPEAMKDLYQCAADGSPSRDTVFEDLQKPARPLSSDEEIRARIYERYLHYGGLRYENELLDMLPQSKHSVFTHADIAPRNIMVDEEKNITGILDWELAGWYPDYWDYAQIMRPAFWGDLSVWMEETAPQRWDLSGMNAARKVCFEI